MRGEMELFPEEPHSFASTRTEALRQLKGFLPRAGAYGRDRNHVVRGHSNVSCLSPAICHRLLTEAEVVDAVLERYAASTVEKFTQEVYWRRYWKAWLSLRPQVWSDYQNELRALEASEGGEGILERARQIERGEGPVEIMNRFSRELVSTGYLHNHARMWFAGWWIHVERLPWQLGADFFFRHLLDADPASNTLSWRWVAGLQTPGKTYLPRRSNIEKYLAPDILETCSGGLELLEHPSALDPGVVSRPEITQRELPKALPPGKERMGVWIQEEDLFPEEGPLAGLEPAAVLVAGNGREWQNARLSMGRKAWLKTALADVAERAAGHYGLVPVQKPEDDLLTTLPDWAEQKALCQVIALRPEVGPLADQLPALREALSARSIELVLLDRPADLALRPYATGGFFTFWKKVQKAGLTPS